MPIHFIDNYPKNDLESIIVKQDGSPLHGEIWVYRQFIQFNDNNLLPNDTWFLKHNFNLSKHPASKRKIEGQIDFLLLSKSGILIIEVKGGGLSVDENDTYYSHSGNNKYETQNPFNQVKEYLHSLKDFMETSTFIYKSVVFPHEAGFELKGPQLSGYTDIFFSKRNYISTQSEVGTNKVFFDFIYKLGAKTKIKNIAILNPHWSKEKINVEFSTIYPELSRIELGRLKNELFPSQQSYGYNPQRINDEVILNENYEILRGLRRNKKTMIQGAPGSGKTVLATKFLAENILRQQKGILYCANKLMRTRFEYIILNDYKLDPNLISFEIFSDIIISDNVEKNVDFLIFDEAQEYFEKGLFDFISKLDQKLDFPKVMILYDPEQSIISDSKELSWYTDFFVESGYTHYHFDKIYRCTQNTSIATVSTQILHNDYTKVLCTKSIIQESKTIPDNLQFINEIIKDSKFTQSEKIILVHSDVLEDFKKLTLNIFKKEIEELTEQNINISSVKIKYTTPLKYRGLENKSVYLITKEISDKTKVQNYVGVTRAMEQLKFILWK